MSTFWFTNILLYGDQSKAAKVDIKSLARLKVFTLIFFGQIPLRTCNPTQLSLIGVGVDFVFPLSQQEE